MGEFVAKHSPISSFGSSDWSEAIAPVENKSILDCNASDALPDDIVFGMPASSSVTDSAMDDRMQYGPCLHGSNFEYESFARRSVTVTANNVQ